jgi:hypothetical protein
LGWATFSCDDAWARKIATYSRREWRQSEIRQYLGRVRFDGAHLFAKRQRFAVAHLLIANDSKKVQRVEIFRLQLENVAAGACGILKEAAPLRIRRMLDRIASGG